MHRLNETLPALTRNYIRSGSADNSSDNTITYCRITSAEQETFELCQFRAIPLESNAGSKPGQLGLFVTLDSGETVRYQQRPSTLHLDYPSLANVTVKALSWTSTGDLFVNLTGEWYNHHTK